MKMVENELEKCDYSQIKYVHFTHNDNLENISKEGLKPSLQEWMLSEQNWEDEITEEVKLLHTVVFAAEANSKHQIANATEDVFFDDETTITIGIKKSCKEKFGYYVNDYPSSYEIVEPECLCLMDSKDLFKKVFG
jgi:hypothetical protein